jgi:hypothetical protein
MDTDEQSPTQSDQQQVQRLVRDRLKAAAHATPSSETVTAADGAVPADDSMHDEEAGAVTAQDGEEEENASDGDADCNSPLIPAGHPRALFTEGYSYGLRILSDRLTVTYVQKAMHLLDVGTVRSDQPIPKAADTPIYYFELNVLDVGERSQITIGFAPLQSSCLFAPGGMHSLDTPCPSQASRSQHETASLTCRQVGMDALSYGYRADDGRKFHAAAVMQAGRPALVGQPYGAAFGLGDTVGAGVNFYTGTVFFTRNGRHLGAAFQLSPSEWSKAAAMQDGGMPRSMLARPVDVRMQLYPAVSLHSKGEQVRLNFGAQPFVFDVAAYAATERAQMQKQISALPFDRALMMPLVRSYLLHQGYEKSVNALTQLSEGALTSGSSSSVPASAASATAAPSAVPQSRHDEVAACTLQARHSIRQLVEAGDMERALDEAEALAPTLWTRTKIKTIACPLSVTSLHLRLLSFRFLSLLRSDSPTRDEAALLYAQHHLWSFQTSKNVRVRAAVEQLLSAFAYPDLRASPLAHMLTEEYRRATADMLNAALLANLSAPSSPIPATAGTAPSAAAKPASFLHGVSSLEILLRHALATEAIIRTQGLPIGVLHACDKEHA